MDLSISDEMKTIWLENNKQNAHSLEGEYDFIVVHDPQPAGLRSMNGGSNASKWIWRCHLDTSNSNPEFWDFYLPYFNAYDARIFTMQQYVGPGMDGNTAIIRPTIDPLSVKNREIPFDVAQDVVARFGVDTQRPIMTQVSRFDPWKDPLGVIDVYRLVKKKIPDIQLALVGGMAADDPEGWYFLDKTSRRAGEDDDIFILHNFHRLGEFEVGCFQTASSVILQKSLREGFGLVVTEALWKGQPVIGGNAGGIPLQVLDGETGFLVDTVEEAADKTIHLLTHPEEARVMGSAGREHVRQNFLITKQLKDYLRLLADLSDR